LLDLTDPTTPIRVQEIPLGRKPNSVSVKNGIIAVALEGTLKTDPGSVKFTVLLPR